MLNYWLISTAIAAVPPQTEAMLVRLESLRADPEEFAPFVVDEDADTRARAATALGRLRDGRGIDSLNGLLADPNPDVRESAAHAMGQIPGTRRTLNERFAKESNTDVRVAILHAVGMQGNAWDIDMLLEVVEQPVTTQDAVDEIGAAANALGQMAIRGINTVRINRVVLTLAQQAKAIDPTIRFNVAFALARIAPTKSPSNIESLLMHAAEHEHEAAIKALLIRAVANLPSSQTILIKSIKHPSPAVRIATARASVSTQWGGVTELLDDPSPSVSMAAIEAIGRIPSLNRIELLGPIVKRGMDLKGPQKDGQRIHPDMARAIAALSALDIPKAWWETDTARYTRVQAGLLPSLSMYMSEDRDPLMRAAATAIAADPENLYRLATADPSGLVRMAAAQRILSDRISYRRAVSLLNAQDPMVLAAVADWLRDQPNPKSEAVLVSMAQRTDEPSLVYSSVMALASLTYRKPTRKRSSGAPVALLPSLLAHKDPSIRAAGLELAKASGTWPKFFEYSPDPIDITALSEIRSAVISTAHGEIMVTLHPEHAPLTVANFARLADAGFYDGLPFHRVIPDFVAQGGDPRGDGWGGPGHTVPDEISAIRYEEGTLGMAVNGQDTGGSQWFISLAPQPHLNDRYTAFGRVTSGLDTAKSLLPGDRIENVSIERIMSPEDRAKDERDRATSMLSALQAQDAIQKITKKAASKTKKKKGRKTKEDQAASQPSATPNTADVPSVPPESNSEDMPEQHDKSEEEDPLLEGEKVDIIDPNED